LSSYANLNIGYVGRNNGVWTSIRWILNSGNLQNGVNRSSLASNSITTTLGRQYLVEYDKNGMLSVNVPWTTDTTGSNNNTNKLFIVGAI
jgi:hypothetical protein